MSVTEERYGTTLTLRLCFVLALGAVFLSLLVTLAANEGNQERRVSDLHQRQRDVGISLARRAAPLLERVDDLRLSVLATSVAELVDGRVVMIDKAGRVRLDTGVTLGGQTVDLHAAHGPIQHSVAGEPDTWEVAAPSLGTDGFAGEVRVRYRTEAAAIGPFPWSLFGLVFLCSVSIITLAGWISHAWVQRVRIVTRQARQAAQGDQIAARLRRRAGSGAVDDLEDAVLQLTAASVDAAKRAREGYLQLAREVVHALELRGHVPAGHPERTRRYALALADELRLGEHERLVVAEAALLADLGKAGVRPTALVKAAGLDDIERDSLRQHPLRGASLVGALPDLEEVALAIRHQHEKWDGAGFPDGLRGDRIPVASRILAIATNYDLMTAGSVYGRPVSWPDALDQLREDRGDHFDPQLVDAFEQVVRRNPPRLGRDERVAISTDGVVPYRAMHDDQGGESSGVEEAVDEILAYSETELEVVFDDPPEDRG